MRVRKHKMSNLFNYLKKYKLNLTIGPFFKLLEAIFELIVPLVMADIIDKGLNQPDSSISFILGRGGILLGLCFVGLGCSLICQYVASTCSQGFGTDLRNSLFQRIGQFSYSQIDTLGQSSLLTRLTSDVNQLQVAVAMLIRLVIRAPFIVVGAAVMSIVINPKLGLIFVFATPVLAAAIYGVMHTSIKWYSRIQKKQDKIILLAKENLNGARVIRAFNRCDGQIENFEKQSDDVNTNLVMVGKISALLNPLCFVIINAAIIAILYFGGGMVNNGSMTQGEIIAFINYLIQISVALVVVANMVVLYTKSYASAKRIATVLDTPIEQDTASINTIIENDLPLLSFDSVSMGYCDNKFAIDNISFSINKGEKIGIIGSTGSGKSSLIKLIPRLYVPQKGLIKVHGQNLSDIKINALKKAFVTAEQYATIFSGTVRSNLQIANPKASDEWMIQALKIAQAYDFVEKKGGLDTVIQEKGRNFSGGQKQRLSIARAIVAQPQCLILDDSLSALDLLTEKKLLASIDKELKDTTLIIVSQRTGSISKCDKIIVLDNGNMVGYDTHTNLLNNCPTYQEIYFSQHKEESHEH